MAGRIKTELMGYGVQLEYATSSSTGSCSSTHVQKVTKKKKSSEKEKQRNDEIKRTLGQIKGLMPYVNCKDLSKIRTLRLASAYIKHLERVLSGEMVFCPHERRMRPISVNDFQQVVADEMQVTNSYKDRAEMELAHDMLQVSRQQMTFAVTPSHLMQNPFNSQ